MIFTSQTFYCCLEDNKINIHFTYKIIIIITRATYRYVIYAVSQIQDLFFLCSGIPPSVLQSGIIGDHAVVNREAVESLNLEPSHDVNDSLWVPFHHPVVSKTDSTPTVQVPVATPEAPQAATATAAIPPPATPLATTVVVNPAVF